MMRFRSALTSARCRSLRVRPPRRARWWRASSRQARCAVCGLIVMCDDAIGLVPTAGLAHAECALVHMLESSEPHAADRYAGRTGGAEQRSGLTEEQWQTLLRALSARDR